MVRAAQRQAKDKNTGYMTTLSRRRRRKRAWVVIVIDAPRDIAASLRRKFLQSRAQLHIDPSPLGRRRKGRDHSYSSPIRPSPWSPCHYETHRPCAGRHALGVSSIWNGIGSGKQRPAGIFGCAWRSIPDGRSVSNKSNVTLAWSEEQPDHAYVDAAIPNSSRSFPTLHDQLGRRGHR